MKNFLLIILVLFSFSWGQESIVSFKLYSAQNAYLPGNSYQMIGEIDVSPTWHINADKPHDPMSIPTELTLLSDNPGISFGRIIYPNAVNRKFSFSESFLNVFEGKQYLSFSVSISPDIEPGEYEIKGVLLYQGCNDATCLPPTDVTYSLVLHISNDAGMIKNINEDIFRSYQPQTSQNENMESDGDLGKIYEEKGMFLYLILVFIAGLALNLTPCVFPLIPITVSYFGNKAEGNTWVLAAHGLFYTLGMAITYSLLGTLAAVSGSLIGGALQNPFVVIAIVLIILALASSMFGAFEIRVPQKLAQIGGKNRSGFGGTLLMGLTVGIIAAPCIGPFVLALVTFVAQVGDWFFGFISFFVLALGLGLPYAVLAIFSSKLNTLPRAGMWMVWVRKVFGFILVGLAIYFVNPLIQNEFIYLVLMAINLVIAGLYLGFIDKTEGATNVFKYIKYIIGIAFLLFGLNYGLDAHREYLQESENGGTKIETIHWQDYSETILSNAQKSGKPVFIDFYADWCEPCKELDRISFRDKEFELIAEKFIMIKADLTKNNDPDVEKLRKKFTVRGVPTLIVIDGQGNIVKSMVGFQEANILVKAMQQVVQ